MGYVWKNKVKPYLGTLIKQETLGVYHNAALMELWDVFQKCVSSLQKLSNFSFYEENLLIWITMRKLLTKSYIPICFMFRFHPKAWNVSFTE